MSKSNSLENSLLLLLFNNTNIANVGDATGVRGSTTAGVLYVSLHNGDPGEAGAQNTNECTYSGYGRISVNRASGAGGFTVTTSSVSPASNVDFAQAGAGASDTATHFGIGTASSGAGVLLYSGVIGSSGPKEFTAKASTDLVTCYAHGLSANDRVVFEALEGVALPTGITQGTLYYVISTGLTTDAFEFSTTQGGSAVDITGDGGGMLYRAVPISITENVIPRVSTSTVITEG